jgi:ferredoxin
MTAKKIDQPTLEGWVDTLVARQKVYGAQAKEDRFAFGPLARGADLRLDYDVTILPPKKYFLPQKEVLLTFTRQGGFESVLDPEPFVLFGVHPYDFVAIDQLRKLFEQDNPDVHYLTRSEAATIVVSDVQKVASESFAGCMDNATVEDREGYDVLLTLLDDGAYVAEARTEKGEALMEPLLDAPKADADDLWAREKVWERNRDALRKHALKMAPSELPDLLDRSYDHPVWEEKAELCYSCGSCNLVCPTCYCFDVQDELNWDLETGQRYRTWDGCMLAKFANVAGNHNFREQKAARYRHRYYRKGKYVWDMIDEVACVGCGRCITACTANIANPVEIFNRLLEEE